MMRQWSLLILLFALVWPASGRASPPTVVADLSSHLIAVTSSFDGANLLLFGALSGEGDVVVVVRGPERDFTVRRKGETFGFWINQGVAAVTDVPAFYFVAASKPLNAVADPTTLRRLGIMEDSLRFHIYRDDFHVDDAAYGTAVLTRLRQQGLYSTQPARIQVLGGQLFRTDILFPSNVPVGVYGVEVYLFQNGNVITAQTTPLVVSRAGLEADIVRFAQQEHLWYGLLVLAFSIALGWLASVVFRRHD